MSSDDIKPKLSEIESHLNYIHISNELKPDFIRSHSFGGLNAKQRLLIPSKLSNSDVHQSQVQSKSAMFFNGKRLSESGDTFDYQNKELSPLFKRIKKENNNCLLFDSKQFIKQELETELDFNSRQPIANLFSNLSLDKRYDSTADSSVNHESGNCPEESEANQLSDVLKQLNICHNSNQINSCSLNSKSKKKKNKKSKKSREKKSNITKNVFKTNYCYNNKNNKKSKTLNNKKEPKRQYLFKIQSKVIKELKVSANGGLTAQEVQHLVELKNDGIVRKNRKMGALFKCLLCKQRFPDLQSAEQHIKSEIHSMNKTEQKFSSFDSRLALDLDNNNDIEILLSRRNVLFQMSDKTKQLLYSKGIRLKNGFGSHAFVCIECNNQCFETIEEVLSHINNKSKLIDSLDNISLESETIANVDTKPIISPEIVNIFDSNTSFTDFMQNNSSDSLIINSNSFTQLMSHSFEEMSSQQLNQLFKSHGIIRRIRNRSKKKRLKYFCTICLKYRDTGFQMFRHINDKSHISAKNRVSLESIQSVEQI